MDPNQPKSTSTSKKWLMGCGIGCGVVLVITIILVVFGVLYVKNLVQGFKDSIVMMETLTERYGRITEYCPEPDGSIKPARLEAFLKVREAIVPSLKEMDRSLNILSDGKWGESSEEETSASTLTKIKTGLGIIPLLADFFKNRNQALLDGEIGMGEYYYIYSLAYYSWLKKSLVDGPDFQISNESNRPRYRDWDDEESLEERRDQLARRLHRMITPILKNQYEKLLEMPVSSQDAEWRAALKKEIDALDSDRYRFPWQDGLPDTIGKHLEPFRDRLEASYSTITNALEIAFEDR